MMQTCNIGAAMLLLQLLTQCTSNTEESKKIGPEIEHESNGFAPALH